MPRLLELFSGTGSVGQPFRERGWEVISVDWLAKFSPTIQTDLKTWDFKLAFPPGHFDVVHASPPCTQYSIARTNAKTPRDLEGADALVARVLEMKAYFQPKVFLMENPSTGMMPKRAVVAGLAAPRVVTYCKYGFTYRKPTAIWEEGLGALWQPRAPCLKASPCIHVQDGRHPNTAQRQPGRLPDGTRRLNDTFTLEQIYMLPRELCEELAVACVAALALPLPLGPPPEQYQAITPGEDGRGIGGANSTDEPMP
jgi:hypothetical protein